MTTWHRYPDEKPTIEGLYNVAYIVRGEVVVDSQMWSNDPMLGFWELNDDRIIAFAGQPPPPEPTREQWERYRAMEARERERIAKQMIEVAEAKRAEPKTIKFVGGGGVTLKPSGGGKFVGACVPGIPFDCDEVEQ